MMPHRYVHSSNRAWARCTEVKKIVSEDMAVAAQVWWHQPHDDSVAEVQPSVLFCASVNLKLDAVPCIGVAQAPEFHAPLHWLLRHVWLPGQAAIELYHRFIDADVLRWCEVLAEVTITSSQQGSHLGQLVASIFLFWQRTVEILAQFLLSAFRQNLRNVWVVEHWICAPVISILRQLLDPHHSVYAVVRFHLSCISHRPVFI